MKPFRWIHRILAEMAEWIGLRVSCLARIDEVAICDLTPAQLSRDAFLDLASQAMAMIKALDARRYHRVCRYIRYIENTPLLSRGQYGQRFKICRVDYAKHFNATHRQKNLRDFAGLLIHEATHGFLFEKSIPYDEETWERVERLCHLEEYRFALHFEAGYADLYPGSYNPAGHKRSRERSGKATRAATWKRFLESWRASFPKNVKDYQQRARTHNRKGEYDKAITDSEKAIQLDPQFSDTYLTRGAAFLKKRLFEKAITDFDQCILLNPQNAVAYINRGTAYLQKQDNDRAIADCDQAIRLNPKGSVAYHNRGVAHLKKRNYDDALADYEHVIQIKPKDASAYLNRGAAHLGKCHYDEAIADYCHAIRFSPWSELAYQNLAWLLATCPNARFRNGKKAVEHATKACVLSEWKDPKTLSVLAAACAEGGDFESALKWQSQYLATPGLTVKAKADAQSRLVLYKDRKPYHQNISSDAKPPV
jgi:tetratricopeptide (TPR) repeat protein